MTRDVGQAERVIGDLLGLPRHDARFGESRAPCFALGDTVLAMFSPQDPYLGAGALPGVHHLALAAPDPAAGVREMEQAGFSTIAAPGGGMALDRAPTRGVQLRLWPALGLAAGRSDHTTRIDHIGIASVDN